MGAYIKQLMDKKELLKAGSGYKLENKIREKLDTAYGKPEITIKVTNLLTSLADTIPNMAERDYYKEALICYRYGSLRAAVVMTWNIAFSHLCDHMLAKRLADFNARKDGVKGQISTFNNFSICFALPCNERSFLSRF